MDSTGTAIRMNAQGLTGGAGGRGRWTCSLSSYMVIRLRNMAWPPREVPSWMGRDKSSFHPISDLICPIDRVFQGSQQLDGRWRLSFRNSCYDLSNRDY